MNCPGVRDWGVGTVGHLAPEPAGLRDQGVGAAGTSAPEPAGLSDQGGDKQSPVALNQLQWGPQGARTAPSAPEPAGLQVWGQAAPEPARAWGQRELQPLNRGEGLPGTSWLRAGLRVTPGCASASPPVYCLMSWLRTQ